MLNVKNNQTMLKHIHLKSHLISQLRKISKHKTVKIFRKEKIDSVFIRIENAYTASHIIFKTKRK